MMMGLCIQEIGILEPNMENCNLINLSEEELINYLVKNLHYNGKWEFCLLRFPKRKIFTISIGSPSFERSCTHVLIGRCNNLNYVVDFVDLKHSVASSYFISQSFLKTLYEDCFFNERDCFSISAVENDKEVSFMGNFVF